MKKLIYSAVLAGALSLANHASAQATLSLVTTETLTGGTSTLTAPTAPGTEYDFFGGGGQPSSLTNFTVTPIAGQTYGGNPGYAYLVAGTSTFTTGILYDGYTQDAVDGYPPGHPGIPDPLLTFQLTPTSTETSFNVFVLTGNTDGSGVYDNALTLSVSGPDSGYGTASTSLVDTSDNNVFTEFTVSGATSSDVFTISATSDSQKAYVGGITFEQATESAVPEPSTWALLGAGVLALLIIQRRRKVA